MSTLAEIQKETITWQRCLALAGYYPLNLIDGITGPKTTAAATAWHTEHRNLALQHGTLDDRTEANLITVCPIIAKALRAWLTGKVIPYCNKTGLTCKIIEGTRTIAAQNKLGKNVTRATGGNSFHNYGLAIDIGLFNGKEYITTDREYRNLHTACGDPADMLWGGTFKSIVDTPHYQIAKYGTGISKVKAQFK